MELVVDDGPAVDVFQFADQHLAALAVQPRRLRLDLGDAPGDARMTQQPVSGHIRPLGRIPGGPRRPGGPGGGGQFDEPPAEPLVAGLQCSHGIL